MRINKGKGQRPPKQCKGCHYMKYDDYYYKWLCQRKDWGASCSRLCSKSKTLKDKYVPEKVKK